MFYYFFTSYEFRRGNFNFNILLGNRQSSRLPFVNRKTVGAIVIFFAPGRLAVMRARGKEYEQTIDLTAEPTVFFFF